MGIIINDFEAVTDAPASKQDSRDVSQADHAQSSAAASDPGVLGATLQELGAKALRVWAH